jgi:hypothetical protein
MIAAAHRAACGAGCLLLVLLAAACGGEPDQPPVAAPDTVEPRTFVPPAAVPERRCVPAEARVGRAGAHFGATVVRALVARDAPGGAPAARFEPVNVNGVPTVLGVLGVQRDPSCRAAWYRVQLPVRPNGATGWVRAADVRLHRVTTAIVVDLSERRVTLLRDGRPVLTSRAAIGKPGTPTPTGRYYVNQRLRAPDPAGPFGPGAVGISAFSPTLQEWAQGGPIAIHGTNRPHLLGEAASHGCVRIANGDLLRLYDLAVEGTPVLIRS